MASGGGRARDAANAFKPHALPFVKDATQRYRVRWWNDAKEVRHATGRRGNAVDFVGNASVRDGSGERKGSANSVLILVDKREGERRSPEWDAENLDSA